MSNSAPLVSVAMITYNHERFITKAIESVLAQRTGFPIELVIGDDASSDHTSHRIESLKAQAPETIRTLIRPANIGMNRNLDGVLEHCRGEFIAFLEGDDYWTSQEKLQIQVDVLRAYDSTVGVFHAARYVDTFDRDIGKIYPEKFMTEIGTQELLNENLMPTASVLIRRNALVSLPDSYQKLSVRDWPMWIFASLHGPWRYLPNVMSAYRIHDGGIYSSLNRAARLAGRIELFHELAAGLPRPFSAMARQQLIEWHLEALEEAFVCDRLADARRELRNLVRLLPHHRMRNSKRLISAVLRTLSPQTHSIAKRALRLIRDSR